jgi:acetyl esterase/lipase
MIENIIRPTLQPQYAVSTETLVYGQGDVLVDGKATPKELLLDLYQPAQAPSGLRPVVLAIHGGGFVMGSRTNKGIVNLASALAARGYVVVSLEYRLAPDHPIPSGRVQGLTDLVETLDMSHIVATLGLSEAEYKAAVPAAMEDALTALIWLANQAESRSLDLSRLVLLGSSAGAFTTLYTVYHANDFGLATPGVAAVIDLWGGFGFSRDAAALEAGEPPIFIVHGTDDPMVPFALSEAVVARAQAVGVPYEFYPLAGYGHGFLAIDLMTVKVDGQTIFEHLVRFLDATLFRQIE